MYLEIERRFLVHGDSWRSLIASSEALCQGYLATAASTGLTVRVRISGTDKGCITLKAPAKGFANYEFEYPIPVNDADLLMGLCVSRLTKTRHTLRISEGHWIVDCFHGENAELVLAEVELEKSDQLITLPDWCVREVTGESRWSNFSLAQSPISSWKEKVRQQYGFSGSSAFL